ncbi:hypothetical protein [Planktothrix sp. FACHB-1365]|uniref:hypothetical protein n=1 Tax=Planktothrix sp. FACHB-1365 TaxID=2692855 RepID=UPI0016845227|nr:hypothetical protein [Planktothrix sp. FACHB-1365]MBD2482494.1 hypothetical protein [Planktothrix sp. FACHB-1365]
MLCLTEEESEKLKERQIQCNQLVEKHNQAIIDCNQSTINAMKNNPFVSVDSLKLIEEYNKILVANKEVVQDLNKLNIDHQQLIFDYSILKLGNTCLGWLLAITYGVLFIKWIIKVERKMSKRDEPKPIPIKFAKRTNPKKGDRF